MKKTIRCFGTGVLLLSTVAALTACGEKNEGIDKKTPLADGVLVLNQGNYYSGINGSLNVLDLQTGKTDMAVFSKVNGRDLGATPQCGVTYGSKIYIATYSSGTVEVLEKDTYKSLAQLKLNQIDADLREPRAMAVYNGKVYISMFSGFVARMDTVLLQIDGKVKTGPNPDGIAVHNGELYVANSGGMSPSFNNTASIVDLSTFNVRNEIQTPLNPTQFISANGELFILCMGNYYDQPAKLYKADNVLQFSPICDATLVAHCGEFLGIINQPFVADQSKAVVEYKLYEIAYGALHDWNITRPDYANSLYYDKTGDRIFIGSYVMNGQYPSYELPGYVNMVEPNGAVTKFPVGSGPSFIFGK